MKKIVLSFCLFLVVFCFSFKGKTVPKLEKEKVDSGVYSFDDLRSNKSLFKGEKVHFSNVDLSVIEISKGSSIYQTLKKEEQIFIIVEGKLDVYLKDNKNNLVKNSVIFVLPNNKIEFTNNSENPVTLYRMVYKAKADIDHDNEKELPKFFMINYDELQFNEHDGGGIRNYFHTNTSMLDYYEMHMTTLKAGIKSHELHTYRASEIVIMVDGNTQMEIGNKIYKGSTGDIYFIESEISHAIENIGDKSCKYFAFQWD